MKTPSQGQGTPISIPLNFPVTWDNADEERYLWRWDNIHSPLPSSPMAISVEEDRSGRQSIQNPKANDNPKRSLQKRINGYSYSAELPSKVTADEKQKRKEKMSESIRTIRHKWDTEIRPTMEADISEIKGISLGDLTDTALFERLDNFLNLTVNHWTFHGEVVGPTHACVHDLVVLYRKIMGDVPDDEPYKLIRGLYNKSLETDQAIRDLASSARNSEQVANAFDGHNEYQDILSELESSTEGQAFKNMLTLFMDQYGFRPTGFDLLFPTWTEDPSFVIMNIKSSMQYPSRDVASEQKKLLKDAEIHRQKVLDKLGDDLKGREEFIEILKYARELWPLKEDHAFYIDQGSAACVRILIAEVGRRLVNIGVVKKTADVFFLSLEEALGSFKRDMPTNLVDVVSKRRQQLKDQYKLIPPVFIGTLPEANVLGDAPEFAAMLSPMPDLTVEMDPSVLRGIAGAGGSTTGPAKIIRSPEQFGKINQGDILVCTSTSPTWTALFGTIRGLVSDSGGVLSHTAIVAREYGLPAVVGVHHGTSRIIDGQIITVNGDDGVVLLR